MTRQQCLDMGGMDGNSLGHAIVSFQMGFHLYAGRRTATTGPSRGANPTAANETGKPCLVAKKMDESALYHDQRIAGCYKHFMDANDKYGMVTI